MDREMGYAARELQIQENRLLSNITVWSKEGYRSFAKDKREKTDTVEVINKPFISFLHRKPITL